MESILTLSLLDLTITPKTALLIVHLVGLAIGIGAATVLDLLILRSVVKRHVSRELASMVQSTSAMIAAGLVLLWLSGIGFLVHYYFQNPVGLTNPKVWAKIAIVAILTINGFFIHKAALPLLKRNAGGSLFDNVPPSRKLAFLTAGAISATSWYVPLALGAVKEINYVVSAETILAGYAVILALAVACAMVGERALSRSAVSPAAESI
jgi:hypothetical protein